MEPSVTLAFLPFEAKVREWVMGEYGQASAPAAKRYDRCEEMKDIQSFTCAGWILAGILGGPLAVYALMVFRAQVIGGFEPIGALFGSACA